MTIAANRLSVIELSAISGNLGTVNAGTINGLNIYGSRIEGGLIIGGEMQGATIYAGPSNAITINANGVSIPDGTSVSGYRLSLGGAQIWGANAGSIYTSAGFFSYGGIGCDGDLFTQGALLVSGAMRWNGADSEGAGIGRPLVVASDGYIHGINNGLNGNYGGFVYANGIAVGTY